MSTGQQIQEMAAEIADQAQYLVSQLEPEIFDLKVKLKAKEAELKAANLALDRLANFSVQIGGDYQCPRCWMEHEMSSSLSPVGGGTQTEDLFRCHTCGHELSVRSR